MISQADSVGPTVSIVVPSYARSGSVSAGLRALATQSFGCERFEIIIVDDGSPEPMIESLLIPDGLSVRVVRQSNQGATAARNRGATEAGADVLIFMDDDIVPSETTIERLVSDCLANPRTIVLGILETSVESPMTRFAREQLDIERTRSHARRKAGRGLSDLEEVPFQECMTGLLAVRTHDFEILGMFEDPSGGWPNWDDVDFGYRAYSQGFALKLDTDAVAEHRDRSLATLGTARRRWYRASHSAVALFERHPELQVALPMFHDKVPIDWSNDGPGLVIRKLIRRLSATQGMMAVLTILVRAAEIARLPSAALRPLYRWTLGAEMRRGYWQGLRDKAPNNAKRTEEDR